MKVRYVGKSFGIDSLTDGKVYEVVCYEADIGALRVIDDSGYGCLYNPLGPKLLVADEPYGRFEIVEDDENGTLDMAINH